MRRNSITAFFMKRNFNTMEPVEYALTNVLWGFGLLPWYYGIRHGIEGLSAVQSALVLLGIIVVCMVAGLVFTIDTRRNYTNAVVNALIPYGIYTLISYRCQPRTLIIVTLSVAALLSAVYVLFCLRFIPSEHPRRELIRDRQIGFGIYGARIIIAFGFAVTMFLMLVNTFLGFPFFEMSERPIDVEEHTIDSHIEDLADLRNMAWHDMTDERRMELLNIVKDIEACHLGLPHDITLVVEDIGDDLAAYYTDSTRTVTISRDYFNNAKGEEMLRVLCHEMYHAYQYRLCDAYDSVDEKYKELLAFDYVKDYRYEMYNYIDADDDTEAYGEQILEKNADKYADGAVGDYMRRINLHLYGEE